MEFIGISSMNKWYFIVSWCSKTCKLSFRNALREHYMNRYIVNLWVFVTFRQCDIIPNRRGKRTLKHSRSAPKM
jgi:hypothetical protein